MNEPRSHSSFSTLTKIIIARTEFSKTNLVVP